MSILVVSDTSPIRALNHVGLTDLLRQFYGTVLIPPAVQRELASPHDRAAAVDLATLPFVILRAPADQPAVQRLRATLDLGEAEAIALAAEVHADVLLIDERLGRAAAAVAGIAHVGVLGILTRAKYEGLIDSVRVHVDRLRTETRFYVSQRLYETVLRSSGE